jgi:hypothetical protein
LVDKWQSSHAAVVGKWFAGLVTIPPTHDIPAPWHVAQPVVMPVWLILVPLNVVVDL